MSDTQNNIMDENDVDLILDGEDDTTTIEETAPASIQLTNEMWIAVGESLGLTNINAQNAQINITEMVRIGQKYDNIVRVNAKKMAIASGSGNMDTFLDGLPHDAVVNNLKNFTQIADQKGLTSGNRNSIATDNGKGPGATTQASAKPGDSDNSDRTPADQVNDTKKQLRASGLYAL